MAFDFPYPFNDLTKTSIHPTYDQILKSIPHFRLALYLVPLFRDRSRNFQAVAKMAILAKFRKVVDEMIRANKLTQLEGPQNVGEFGENGDFGEISPRLLTK